MIEAETDWPAQWLRGPLSTCVLHVIAVQQPVHGYGVSGALEAAGLGNIRGGTLYPMLARLERDGHVETHWEPGNSGPARKTYTITPAGSAHLKAESEGWLRFTAATTALLKAKTMEPMS